MNNIENLKAEGRYFEAGQLARAENAARYFGCHYGMCSERDAAIAEFYRGYDAPAPMDAVQSEYAEELRQYEQGRAWAESLSAGDAFLGTMGEAEQARGLTGLAAKFFSLGAQTALPKVIIIDNTTGCIARLER